MPEDWKSKSFLGSCGSASGQGLSEGRLVLAGSAGRNPLVSLGERFLGNPERRSGAGRCGLALRNQGRGP
jgi:hypothetical protein